MPVLVIHTIKCFNRLYGLWKSDTYSQYPMLMRKKADIQKKSKAIMQRISKENVKPTSRKIGKVTNSSPVLLFDYVSRMESMEKFLKKLLVVMPGTFNIPFD